MAISRGNFCLTPLGRPRVRGINSGAFKGSGRNAIAISRGGRSGGGWNKLAYAIKVRLVSADMEISPERSSNFFRKELANAYAGYACLLYTSDAADE